MRQHRMFGRMKQSPPEGSAPQPVVPRVLEENRRIRKILEKISRSLVGKRGPKPLAVSLGTLTELWVGILCLRQPRVEAHADNRQRIQRVLDE